MADKYGLATDYNSELISQYLSYADNSVASKRQAGYDQVAANQSLLNEMLGRQQLATERDIANRRIQAQRSGMSSAQLAALEVQNIMAGQLGATQVAQQAMLENAAVKSQFAGAEADTRAALFEVLNTNRSNVAAIDAQKYSASAVSQMRELFPNASEGQLLALAKNYLGIELSDSDQALITAASMPQNVKSFADTYNVSEEVATMALNGINGAPLDFKSFSNDVLGRSRAGNYDEYQKYITAFNKLHKTTYVAGEERIRSDRSNRTPENTLAGEIAAMSRT